MGAIDRFKLVIGLDFVNPCLCQYCKYIIPNNPIFCYYYFAGTSIYIGLTFLGDAAVIKYYANGCPYSPKIYSLDFDTVIKVVPEEVQYNIIYHINLFG